MHRSFIVVAALVAMALALPVVALADSQPVAAPSSLGNGTWTSPLTTEPAPVPDSLRKTKPQPGDKKPSPYVICAACDGGGGSNWTCVEVGGTNGDWSGSYIEDKYHFCFNGSQVADAYGWATPHPCSVACSFGYWNYNYDFSYGHKASAHFYVVTFSLGFTVHLGTDDGLGICVNGQGQSWYC